MLHLTDKASHQVSPTELELLQDIYDRVCMWCNIARPSARSEGLARFIMDEFHAGNRTCATLFASAMWREAKRSSVERREKHQPQSRMH